MATTYTPSLFIKYIVLSFLQEQFKYDVKYPWKPNPKETDIIIADKYAMEMGVAAKRPSIILDRGNVGWSMNYRNEAFPNTVGEGSWVTNRKNNYRLRDLMRGTVTLMVVDKKPFKADEIANSVFLAISGYREFLKEKGIHRYTGLNIGKESVMKAGSEVEVSAVPVQFSFMWEETISLGERLYNARVYLDDDQVYENVDYTIKPSGTEIEFMEPVPDGVTASIDYIDAITLQEIKDKDLIPTDGSNTLYVVPNGGSIYGYYEIIENLVIDNDSEEWINI